MLDDELIFFSFYQKADIIACINYVLLRENGKYTAEHSRILNIKIYDSILINDNVKPLEKGEICTQPNII